MSCHYSCSSCSAAIYMFKCLSCPSTRTLFDSTCFCKDGYYERQQPNCYASSQADVTTQMILPVATWYYYSSLSIFWLYAILLFCRVNSPKIRMAVNFGQIFALLLNYPFIFDQISKSFINSITTLNFSYFLKLYTCQTGSQVCQLFQYFCQPLIVLPCLFACFVIGFLVTKFIYRHDFTEPIGFQNYLASSWFLVFFSFVDLTAVIYGYNITKSALKSNFGFIFVGLYFIVLMIVIVKFFRIINTQEQTKIMYRTKNAWAFGYDQYYHFYFIDFLYSSKEILQQPEIQNQTIKTTLNLSSLDKQKEENEKKRNKVKMFTPHSNLFIFELLMKVLCGSTTVLLYEYKPTFMVIPLVILINILVCWMGIFFYYDKSSLLFYWILSIAVLGCSACYWVPYYWIGVLAVSSLIIALMLGSIIMLFFTNKKLNGKLLKKVFQGTNLDDRKQQESQQQFQLKSEATNPNDNENQNKIEQNLVQGEERGEKGQKKQPFSGNLTKKTKAIFEATNGVLSEKKSGETLKNIAQNEEQEEIQNGGDNIIKHSKYQSILSNRKSKLSVRNVQKNKNQLQGKDKNSNEIISNKNRTKIKYNNRDQDFLSNVLQEPGQQELQSIAKNGKDVSPQKFQKQ